MRSQGRKSMGEGDGEKGEEHSGDRDRCRDLKNAIFWDVNTVWLL
jgi:hypothetical protein